MPVVRDWINDTTIDDIVVRSVRHHMETRPWYPDTPSGLPWEIALITDLDAQKIAALAWRRAYV